MQIIPPRKLAFSHRVMLTAAMLGIFLAHLLEIAFSASGLMFLNVSLNLPVIGTWGVALAFAIIMQLAALVSGYVLAGIAGVRKGWRDIPLGAFALAAVLAFEGVGGALHFTQLANLSRGDDLAGGLRMDMQVLQARLQAADSTFRAVWVDSISSYRALVDDSAAGRDRTRVAICGPLCQEADSTARKIRTEFAALGTPTPVPDTTKVDTAAGYAALMITIDALRPKSMMLERMCVSISKTCVDPLGVVLADASYARLQQAFGGATKAQRVALVLKTVEDDVRHLFAGQAEALTYLMLAITLVLPAASMVLMIHVRALTRRPRLADEIETMTEEERRIMEVMAAEESIAFLHSARRKRGEARAHQEDVGSDP